MFSEPTRQAIMANSATVAYGGLVVLPAAIYTEILRAAEAYHCLTSGYRSNGDIAGVTDLGAVLLSWRMNPDGSLSPVVPSEEVRHG